MNAENYNNNDMMDIDGEPRSAYTNLKVNKQHQHFSFNTYTFNLNSNYNSHFSLI